jgi:hypothetical protein
MNVKSPIKFRRLWNCCWGNEACVITMFDGEGNEAYHAVCSSCGNTYARQNGAHLMRAITPVELASFDLEPRVVGDLCYSHYWGQYYLVTAREQKAGATWITCLWLGKQNFAERTDPTWVEGSDHVTRHCTAWDFCNDAFVDHNLTKPVAGWPWSSYAEFLKELRDRAVKNQREFW